MSLPDRRTAARTPRPLSARLASLGTRRGLSSSRKHLLTQRWTTMIDLEHVDSTNIVSLRLDWRCCLSSNGTGSIFIPSIQYCVEPAQCPSGLWNMTGGSCAGECSSNNGTGNNLTALRTRRNEVPLRDLFDAYGTNRYALGPRIASPPHCRTQCTRLMMFAFVQSDSPSLHQHQQQPATAGAGAGLEHRLAAPARRRF